MFYYCIVIVYFTKRETRDEREGFMFMLVGC